MSDRRRPGGRLPIAIHATPVHDAGVMRIHPRNYENLNDNADNDPRLYAIPDIHGHAKGEHKAFTDERPIPLSARMLFLWFYHACRRGWPRFLMVTDHMNYLTFEDPAAINLVRRALKLAQAGDLYGAAETASVEVGHAAVVSEGLRRGMHYSIGAEVDNDPRSRPDAQNIVDAMKPDGMIRSVHFLTIDHPTHGAGWNWPFDNPEFADVHEIVGAAKTWELYMATLLDAIERLPGNIVGHFYVPAIFGHWPDDATLEAYENQLVDACEARGMAIELNTRFLYRDHPAEEKAKYLTAYRRLLAKCKAKNVGVAVGSDAHSPKDQGRAFETILSLLDECEINELVFPIAGRLARVALRVERKPDPVAATEPVDTLENERKAVRKARTSEAPSRPKESSSKRDDTTPATNDETEPPDEAVVKPKARPKRAKGRATPVDNVHDEQAQLDPAPVDAEPSSAADSALITDTPSTFEEPLVSAATAEPSVTDVPAATAEPSVTDVPAEPGEPSVADVPAAPGEPSVADVPAAPGEPSVTDVSSAGEAVDPVVPPDGLEAVAAVVPASSDAAREFMPDDEPERAAAIEDRDSAVGATAVADVEEKPRVAAAKAKSAISRVKPTPKKATKPSKPAAKAGAKKTAAKRAPVAKKTAVKKASAKKTAVKKAVAKKAPPRAAVAKKAAVKKAGAKKTAVKKTGAKKTAPKRR